MSPPTLTPLFLKEAPNGQKIHGRDRLTGQAQREARREDGHPLQHRQLGRGHTRTVDDKKAPEPMGFLRDGKAADGFEQAGKPPVKEVKHLAKRKE